MQALHKVRNPVAEPKRQGGSKLSTMRNMPRKPVRQFGDYCFDYIEACKHNLQPNKYNDPYQSCPLCKLTTIYTNLYFKEEEEKRLVARQQSLQNRAKLRIKLLYLWSKCQNAYYYNRYPQYNHCIDMMLSMTVTDLMIAFESVFESELDTPPSSSTLNKPTLLTPKSIIHPFIPVKSHPLRINLPSLLKHLHRYYRMIEIGHFAAIRIQACVRRYLAQIKMRYYLLQRFEYVSATRTQSGFFYDTWKQKKWLRYPLLLHDETPATPRTIQRRIQYEQRKHHQLQEERGKKGIVTTGDEDDDEANMINVLDHDYTRIQYVKQFILWYDLILCIMYRFSTLVPMNINIEPSASIASSQGGQKDSGKSSRKQLTTAQQKAHAPEAPVMLCPVWVVPSAPGLSSRELGLTVALETLPSPAATTTTAATATSNPATTTNTKDGNKKDLASKTKPTTATPNNSNSNKKKPDTSNAGSSLQQNTAYLNRTLMILEQAGWMSLQCSTPEEVLHIVLSSDLVPVYESVVNFARDEFAIWNPGNQIIPTVNQLMSSASAASSTVASLASSQDITTSHNTTLPPEQQQQQQAQTTLPLIELDRTGEVLPLRIQLRPCHYLLPSSPAPVPSSSSSAAANLNPLHAPPGPSGCFRVFVYDQELIGISAISPWVCYPEIVKYRDQILSSIRLYVNSMEIRTFMHEYYLAANRNPTESTILIHTPPPAGEAQQPPPQQSTKKKPLLSSAANRHKPVTSSSASTSSTLATPNPAMPTIEILHPTTSSIVFVPPEQTIFPVPPPAAATNQAVSSAMSIPSSGASISTLGTMDYVGMMADQSVSRNTGTASSRMSGIDSHNNVEHKVIHDVKQYTEQQMKSLHEKYKFISKHRGFIERYERIQYNEKRRQQKQQQGQQSANQYLDNNDSATKSNKSNDITAMVSSSLPVDVQVMRAIFHTMKPHLQGELVYNMLSTTINAATTATSTNPRNTPNNNSTTNNAATTTNASDWTAYEEKLFSMSLGMDGLMERRVTTTTENKLDCFRDGQLFVMDVYVTLPKPKPLPTNQANSSRGSGATGGGGGGGLSSANSSNSLNSNTVGTLHHNSNNNSTSSLDSNISSRSRSNSVNYDAGSSAGTNASAIFPINIHQIIGVFCCSEEKAAANLDCGLFDYEQDFLGLFSRLEKEAQERSGQHGKKLPQQANKLPRGTTTASTASTSSIASTASFDPTKAWSPPNGSSGISVFKQPLPSGKELQMKIIANVPSREYLEETLPKKIKMWLGLPV